MNTKFFTRILFIFSIVLFIFSLTQESYYVDKIDYGSWSNSFVLLLIGWIGLIMGGGAAISWLANPFIFLSWVFFFKNIRFSIFFSTISFIFALSFLFFDNVITSEAPTFSKITKYRIGYWSWLISIFIFLLGSIFIYFKNSINKKQSQSDTSN